MREANKNQLFHGPPGTGKTSLSFAIAGVFGLDVFCLSLAEPTITEEDLVNLFDELPERCLVLLEDVDSAGLVVRNSQTQDNEGVNSSRISLSGLLNVIDGVASQEGRVLIMTTNHVSSLDSALLRPGRVDVRIHFDLATKEHSKDMFLQAFGGQTMTDTEKVEAEKAAGNLEMQATDFASRIPEKCMSPAEVQGYLMNWKQNPGGAVANIDEWVAQNKTSAGKQ